MGQATEDSCFFLNSPIFIRRGCPEEQRSSCSLWNTFRGNRSRVYASSGFTAATGGHLEVSIADEVDVSAII
jgi:hypothetical protein